MTKVIRLNERLPKREEMRRAIRLYEKRKETLGNIIEWLRDKKEKTKYGEKE